IDDHGVVDRVAGDGEDRRQCRQVEFEPEEGKDADRRYHVVESRDYRADPELPLEAEPDIYGNGEEGEDGGGDPGPDQLRADLRPDDLDPAELDRLAENILHLLDRRLLPLVAA